MEIAYAEKDTVGILFAAAAYHNLYPEYDSVNVEYIAFILRNVEKMKEYSLKDFYRLKLIILYYYVQSDKSHIEKARAINREVFEVANRENWDEMMVESLLFEYSIAIKNPYKNLENDFLDKLKRFNYLETDTSRKGVLYSFLLGKVHFRRKQYRDCEFYFEKAYKKARNLQLGPLGLSAKLYVAQVCRLQKKYALSLSHLEEAEAYSKDVYAKNLDRWMHEEFAFVYSEGYRDFQKADFHWRMYFGLIKELESITNNSFKVPDLQLKLIEERLSSENQRLTTTNEFIQKELKNKSTIMILSLFVAILLAAIAFLIFLWAKQYRENVEKRKYELIHDAQELERQKISQDLHDSVASYVFAIKSYISSDSGKFNVVSQYLDNIYNQIRQTSHVLTSKGVQEVGIVESCYDFIALFKDKMDIQFQVHGEQYDLPPKFSVMVYRIIQEIILNAMKHAEASSMFFSIYFEKNSLTLNISDNGKGFDTKKKFTGLGLVHMKENIAILDGQLEISSSELGTSFWIEFPIK